MRRIGITPLPAEGWAQKVAQSAIIRRRFSNRSPRRYAASTLSPSWRAVAAYEDRGDYFFTAA